MVVYFSVIAIVLVFGSIAQYLSVRRPVIEKTYKNGIVVNKNQYSFNYFILVATFIFVGGFRYYVGTDFGAYYKSIYTLEEVINAIKTFEEPIVKAITFFCRQAWDEGIFVIFVLNLIIVLLTFYAFSKYDENNITLFLLLYLFIGSWSFSFNGTRQAVACAIIFVGASIIEKENNTPLKQIIKIIIICLVAYLSHKSAVLLIPILLVSNLKFDTKQILILIGCAIAIPLLFDNAYEVMDFDINNQEAMEYYKHEINPIRVPVAIAPLLLLALIRDKEELFRNERFITNMAFFHAILTLTTMRSAYMHRITHYTQLFVIVFIVRAIKRIDVKIRWIVIVSVISLYFGYFLYGLISPEDPFVFQWAFSHFGEF